MNNTLLPVNDHPGLLRDKHSKALLNTDVGALTDHKNKKKLAEEVKALSGEVQDIKRILLQIVDNLNRDK